MNNNAYSVLDLYKKKSLINFYKSKYSDNYQFLSVCWNVEGIESIYIFLRFFPHGKRTDIAQNSFKEL